MRPLKLARGRWHDRSSQCSAQIGATDSRLRRWVRLRRPRQPRRRPRAHMLMEQAAPCWRQMLPHTTPAAPLPYGAGRAAQRSVLTGCHCSTAGTDRHGGTRPFSPRPLLRTASVRYWHSSPRSCCSGRFSRSESAHNRLPCESAPRPLLEARPSAAPAAPTQVPQGRFKPVTRLLLQHDWLSASRPL